jgi:hypothetical protein
MYERANRLIDSGQVSMEMVYGKSNLKGGTSLS